MDLTEEEKNILALIQRVYGGQNTPDKCFIQNGDAIIFVEATDSTLPIAVNLSTIANVKRRDGKSDEEIIDEWLTIK